LFSIVESRVRNSVELKQDVASNLCLGACCQPSKLLFSWHLNESLLQFLDVIARNTKWKSEEGEKEKKVQGK